MAATLCGHRGSIRIESKVLHNSSCNTIRKIYSTIKSLCQEILVILDKIASIPSLRLPLICAPCFFHQPTVVRTTNALKGRYDSSSTVTTLGRLGKSVPVETIENPLAERSESADCDKQQYQARDYPSSPRIGKHKHTSHYVSS